MQLVPYFQPIVDIASGKVIGHEVLARTYDHDGNVKSAGYLFSDPHLDEQKILAYDRAVRLQAIQRFAEAGQPGFLTLNISPRWIDLLEDEWIPTIEMLELYNVSPEKIVIEIVETSSDPEKLLAMVKRYKAIGIRIAVDDFGSGSSQFDRVIKLEPDIVKLDMHLFKRAMQGGIAQNIVQSLSFLAERMGSQILCEGVETYPELRFALDIGCKLIQGYMFSEANNHFCDAGIFAEDIAENRRQFLQEGIRKEERIIADSRHIHKEVTELCNQIRNNGHIDKLQWIESNHILSLFICDVYGTQISPTFRKNPACEWQDCHDKIGYNWSWRPYFYQLISGAETLQRLCVTSRSYHDVTTGTLVKTIARFVDKDRILMVDIKEEKSFLYAADVL